jgi:hypothetical protein
MSADIQAEQQRDWQLLHDAITGVLDLYGLKDPFRKGDYWLLDENWGRYSQQLEFQNLQLFDTLILTALQDLLRQFPDWYITIRVDVVGKEDQWPGMGVIVYRDRIVDDLKRDFLPSGFPSPPFGEIPAAEAERTAERVRNLMALTQLKRPR